MTNNVLFLPSWAKCIYMLIMLCDFICISLFVVLIINNAHRLKVNEINNYYRGLQGAAAQKCSGIKKRTLSGPFKKLLQWTKAGPLKLFINWAISGPLEKTIWGPSSGPPQVCRGWTPKEPMSKTAPAPRRPARYGPCSVQCRVPWGSSTMMFTGI